MPNPVDVGFILPGEALPVDIGVVVEAFDVEALVVACDDLAQSNSINAINIRYIILTFFEVTKPSTLVILSCDTT